MTTSHPTRIFCIRHGETDWNASGRWQGRAPVPLNATGYQQAAALSRWLAAHGPRFEALYCSPNIRAWQTAEALVPAVQRAITPDERLVEVDVGAWQGLTREEAIAQDPEYFARYAADWINVPPPNGETRGALQVRARAAFDDIAARHTGQTVALVTHGGTLGMLIASLFGKIERPSLSNTSLTIVERAPAATAWELVRVAWTPHLDDSAIGETW